MSTPTALTRWTDALKLMRIPFSVYLMPIFWLAASQYPEADIWRSLLTFFILHVLVYGGSNGFNSYHDKDDQPVGGLKVPPKVNQELWYLIIVFDLLTVSLSYLLGPLFLSWVVAYVLASKAYSWPGIRLKAYPVMGTAVVVLLQGAGTYYMTLAGLGLCSCEYGNWSHLLLAAGATITLLGNYPLTQVYQHQEDEARGDMTLSRLLGIRGTFIWAMGFTALGGAMIGLSIYSDFDLKGIWLFLVLQLPAQWHMTTWRNAVWKDERAANHENAMKMNQLASLGFSAALIVLTIGRRLLYL